jgi:hypothetical protein
LILGLRYRITTQVYFNGLLLHVLSVRVSLLTLFPTSQRELRVTVVCTTRAFALCVSCRLRADHGPTVSEEEAALDIPKELLPITEVRELDTALLPQIQNSAHLPLTDEFFRAGF